MLNIITQVIGQVKTMSVEIQIAPIVVEGMKWIKEKLSSPSKNDLVIKISDLEQQIERLSYDNQVIVQNYQAIIDAILKGIGAEIFYTVNADTIVFSVGNSAPTLVDSTLSSSQVHIAVEPSRKPIFLDLDDEIKRARLKFPDEME